MFKIFFVRKGRRASYNKKPFKILRKPRLMPVLPEWRSLI